MSRGLRRTLLVVGVILIAVALPVLVGGGFDFYRELVRVDQTAPTFDTVSTTLTP